MKKLYEKNELTFALVWIAIYVAGTTLAETLNEVLGVFKICSVVFHIAMAAVLLQWVIRTGLTEKYGLFLPRYRLAVAWFFLPLVLVCLYKVCFSPVLRFSPAEAALYVVSMLCVGFLEELVFRGFLFRAIEKRNLTQAIVISSITFGIGHIVNLLNGQDIPETVGQILFAVIVGFALVILFYKGKSLIPCMIFHGVFNALSIVANDEALYRALGGPVSAMAILVAASAVLLGGYSLRNLKHLRV
ncbi:MAG: CPBP family intramembrane metalloprotease [Clostridia bacterium]|nr:CPBP family intramembrane metalloprotease [Clostridia bacterium]